MRDIIFRGKSDDDKWEYGSLIISNNITNIINNEGIVCNVIPDTVGQYTGITIRSGDIYEGDIVKGLFWHGVEINGICGYRNGSFGLIWNRGDVQEFNAFTSLCNVDYEIIGNIHDNPNLLKQERCKDCKHCICVRSRNKWLYKCEMLDKSSLKDIRENPSCNKYEGRR